MCLRAIDDKKNEVTLLKMLCLKCLWNFHNIFTGLFLPFALQIY